MRGLMQDWPLLLHRIIDHAAIFHGGRQVISRSVEGPFHTTNYREVRERALKVSQRLDKDGIKLGDRVATLAWNTWRHLEAWYGILGIGALMDRFPKVAPVRATAAGRQVGIHHGPLFGAQACFIQDQTLNILTAHFTFSNPGR